MRSPSPAKLQQQASLKDYNTLGFEVKAEHLAIVDDYRQLPALVARFGQPKLILGGGSNVVITQDLTGLVILNRIKGATLTADADDRFTLALGAGEDWDQSVRYACERQLWGIENLGLIPGTVGAAPIQNIGAYGVELCSVLKWLDAYELATGAVRRFTNAECQFGYRHSVFKNELKNQYVITQVGLELSAVANAQVDYAPVKQQLASQAEPIQTPEQIYNIVCAIRASKLPDPKLLPNVGSFFKNPLIGRSQFDQLKHKYPNIPHYPGGPGKTKLAAGWLIDQAGWKGKQHPTVGVHKDQALVLVNHNRGNAQDLLQLAHAISSDVERKFGVHLEAEPTIVTD